MGLGPSRDPSARAVAGRTSYLILHNTSEVVTPDPAGRAVLRYPRGAIVFQEGRVLEVGPGPELTRRHPEARPLNAYGKLVTPGLVDCHTHMIFAGHRAAEFQRRLKGEGYAAIAASGGGIRSTVAATAAERDDTRNRWRTGLSAGVPTAAPRLRSRAVTASPRRARPACSS
jgi:imidazolonepropionase-like amidohydrolase